MRYKLKFSDKAKNDFRKLPSLVRKAAREHAEILADSPSTHGRKVASPPCPPGGMMSEFSLPIGLTLHHVVFFFKYAANETTLNINNIGYTALSADTSGWSPPD
jgi:hypothetical protein